MSQDKLESAATKYCSERYEGISEYSFIEALHGFRAGAKWQQDQTSAKVKELEAKLSVATLTINKMQNALGPWTRGESIMGIACRTAFNLGVEFNSKHPNEFNAFLAKETK